MRKYTSFQGFMLCNFVSSDFLFIPICRQVLLQHQICQNGGEESCPDLGLFKARKVYFMI